MTYPTIFERLRAMQPEESLSALIGEACDVGDELVGALDDAREAILSLDEDALGSFVDPHTGESIYPLRDELLSNIATALAKARRCPDGECTEKCANGGAA